MRYRICVLLAFALVIGAFMLGAWSIHEVVQIGTCASGDPMSPRGRARRELS